jgi:hypothetical protein
LFLVLKDWELKLGVVGDVFFKLFKVIRRFTW